MRILFLTLLSLSVLLQSGCVIVSSFAKIEPQLNQWEEEGEYGSALDALGSIDPKDPDYSKAAELRRSIEKQAAEYEQKVRKETSQKQQKGDWASALDQYDEALNKYPQSAVIKDGLAILHQQQTKELEQLESERLILHGEWLRDAIPIYQDITRVDPRSRDAQNRLKRIQDEAADIAHELAIIGNRALTDDDLETADTVLPLAAELHSDPPIEESLKALRSRQSKLAKQRQKARHQQALRAQAARESREKALAKATYEFQQAFNKKDYLTARQQLADIERIDRHYKDLGKMRATLQQAIDKRVEQLFSSGVSSYSRGQFEQAARNWRSVLELEPDHQQAKENLERAEKVLKRLEDLKNKQQN